MNKLFIDNYGNITGIYNVETDAYRTVNPNCEVTDIYVAEEPGQVQSDFEVIDYNAEDIIISFSTWDSSLNKRISKVVVATDMAAKADIKEWFNRFNRDKEECNQQTSSEEK